jgi:UDP-N-acetylglucosamine--N-acetylmuramyl-(pentapeptide) pyrophosphoryl-undecaprenol N-acetylglucosamine transferase
MSKRIVLTGGGTAGHVTPHLSLIPRLKEMGYEIHYIGTNGIEKQMIAKIPDIQYHEVKSGKLRRYFSWQNFIDPFKVVWGALQSVAAIAKIKPDVCFSKGGFVSVPVVIGAWLCRVPTVCHESDLTPGLANRICTRFAKTVCTTFAECAKAIGAKGVHTGTPLRPELFKGSRAAGLALAGFDGSKPVLLMTGGSLGAQSVNKCLRESLPQLLPHMDVLHLCGKGNLDESLKDTKGYCQKEFLSEENIDLHREYVRQKKLKYSIIEGSVPEFKGAEVKDIYRMKISARDKTDAIDLLSEITAHDIFFSSFSSI